MYDVNVLGLLRVTQALLPALRASGDGLILNVGSTAGRVAYEKGGGYTAAKHATKAVTETLRLELNGEPIRVSEVAPGMVHTEEFALVRFGGDQAAADAVYDGVPDPLSPTTSPTPSPGWRPGRPTSTSTSWSSSRARRPPSTRSTGSADAGSTRSADAGVHAVRDAVRRGPPSTDRSAACQTAPVQTIGLIGGMSWESSLVYYRDLNVGVQERLGGLSSPKLVLSTVDFAELTHLEDDEKWDQIGTLLADAALGVERAGADFLMLCTTTFHKVADQVAEAVDIPLLHLADVVSDACTAAGMDKVAFIGTTVAMNDPFFISRIADGRPRGDRPGRPAPRVAQRRDLRRAGARSLVDRTRRRVVSLIDELWDAGAGGVLLGCTELELLIRQADTELPVFPCTTLHVQAALDRALA